MLGWFKRKPTPAPEPLRGAPEVRRLKTHQAETGYVYQYYFDGWRPTQDGHEFVFAASSDRSRYWAVPVLIEDAGVRAWEQERGRELISAERHAVAKLALFAAFDQRPPAALTATPIRVDGRLLAEILASVGRD